MIRPPALLGIWVLLGAVSAAAIADDSSIQPYIDHLKKEQAQEGNTTPAPQDESTMGQPYIDSIKAKMKNAQDPSQDYSQKIKTQLQGGNPSPQASSIPSYSEDEKAKIGPGDQGSSIQAVQEGHSDLKYEKRGEIHSAFGIKFGVGLTRNLVADSQVGTGQAFGNVYGGNYAPDIALYYEYELLRGDVGKLGLFGMAEFGIFKGFGTFQVDPVDAVNPGSFLSDTTTVQFTYIEVPSVGGIDYRFSLSKYVEPFVMGGPALIGGMETRNDGGGNHSVLSYGYYGAGGISILMDWISRHDDWDRYADYGIKHAYLNIEYSTLQSIGGPVSYSIAGPNLGVTFEF